MAGTSMLKKILPLLLLITLVVISLPAFYAGNRDLNYGQNILRLLGEFFPPDFSVWRSVLSGLFETLQMSVIATLIATFVALPLAVASSKKFSPLGLQGAVVVFLSITRAIPSLIWALIAVSIVGPYPLAGVIALVFYSLGYLGKFFADAIDSQNLEVVFYYRRMGAGPWQAFQYGLWPQLKKLLFRHVLWMLEYNIRSASVIGYVGAGGLGTYLHIYQEYGRWDRFSFVILLIFIIAIGFELVNRWPHAQKNLIQTSLLEADDE